MNSNNKNFELYNYFLSLNIPFKSARVNAWSLEDKYNSLPIFKFRFIDRDKNDIIYKKIAKIISEFKGNNEWILYTEEKYINYIIKPKNNIINKKFIDDCIDDIPNIIELLKSRLNPDIRI